MRSQIWGLVPIGTWFLKKSQILVDLCIRRRKNCIYMWKSKSCTFCLPRILVDLGKEDNEMRMSSKIGNYPRSVPKNVLLKFWKLWWEARILGHPSSLWGCGPLWVTFGHFSCLGHWGYLGQIVFYEKNAHFIYFNFLWSINIKQCSCQMWFWIR